MSDFKVDDIEKLKELINMRSDNPEDYKKFMQNFEGLLFDFVNIMTRVQKKMEEELGE